MINQTQRRREAGSVLHGRRSGPDVGRQAEEPDGLRPDVRPGAKRFTARATSMARKTRGSSCLILGVKTTTENTGPEMAEDKLSRGGKKIV